MKNVFTILFLLFLIQTNSQSQFVGKYKDYWEHELKLNSDSSFIYSLDVCKRFGWTIGTWSVKNDTIHLKQITLYDTIRFRNCDKKVRIDSLVVSRNLKSKIILCPDSIDNTYTGVTQIIANFKTKFYKKRDRLYLIDEKGQLIKEEWYVLPSKERFPLYYFKEKEKNDHTR